MLLVHFKLLHFVNKSLPGKPEEGQGRRAEFRQKFRHNNKKIMELDNFSKGKEEIVSPPVL